MLLRLPAFLERAASILLAENRNCRRGAGSTLQGLEMSLVTRLVSALTPTLSPRRGISAGPSRQLVRCPTTSLDPALHHRPRVSPSPGGEGRGEDGRLSQTLFTHLGIHGKLRATRLSWVPLFAIPLLAQAEGRFEFMQPQMGLPFRIVLYATNEVKAQAAADAAFARIAELNRILSDYDTDSELSQLSRTAGENKVVKLSDDLWRVLRSAQEMAERSSGAFDVTVGPVVSLWRKARREQKLPDPVRLEAARAAIGYKNLVLDGRTRTAKLLLPGMRLDLGGIAKGYAIDEALKVLRARGINRALVAGGGDMAVGVPPPGKKGWRIEVAPLDASNAPSAKFVLLKRAALATSGDLFQHLEIDGKRYSHIVDPRTGLGLTDHSLVSVTARNCMTADGLATAVSVLGSDAGLKLIERTSGAAVRIVRKPAERIEVFASRRWGKFESR